MTVKTKKQKAFEKYKNTTARHLTESIVRSIGEDLYISVSVLRRDCGKLQQQSKRRWIYDIFKDEFPFFHVINKGSNLTKKLSLIRLDQGNLPEILDLMEAQEQDVIFSIQYAGMTQDEIDALPRIPVDRRSLDNYIVSTRSQMGNPKKKPLRESMRRYLADAEKLQKLLNALEARGISDLPYVQERNDFGRYYQKGINLQSIPKIVRHAALGKCYEYDLNSAVVSLKLLLASQIVQEFGYDFTRHHRHSKEWVSEKGQVTKRLGQLLTVRHHDKPSLIKKLVTALVFGASLSDRAWKSPHGYKFSSFTDIIKKPEDRKALVDDGWLKAFAKEQTQQNDWIVEYSIDIARTWIDEDKLKTPSGRWDKKKVMVLIYQHYETELMRRVIKTFRDKILLHVHDAIYTSKPLNREKLEGIVDGFLADFGLRAPQSFMDLKFSNTDHKAYSDNQYVPPSDLEKLVEAFDRSAKRKAVSHPIPCPKPGGRCSSHPRI